MLNWIHYALLCVVAIVVTAALVPLVRRFAIAHNVIDQPGGRRVNTKAIPRLGGLAMYGGMFVAFLAEFFLEYFGVFRGPIITLGILNWRMVGAFAGITFIVIIGVIDDFIAMPALLKFLGQIAAACIIVFTGTLLENIKVPFGNEIISLGVWAYPITILYLVAFANIINLIDGLDGLAAGVTGICALTMFLLTVSLGRGDAATIAIILVGICIAFLIYNFYPASIFMGDSGSLLLGITLGTVSLMGATRFTSITALAVPIIIAGVPVIDTLCAIIRRVRGHKSISTADSEHIHHKLLGQGFSQRKAVLIIYAWTAVLSVAAYIAWNLGGVLKYSVLIAVFIISTVIIWRMGLFGPVLRHHFFPRSSQNSNGASQNNNVQGDVNLQKESTEFTDETKISNSHDIKIDENKH